MKPNPNRDYVHEIEREVKDLDAWGQWQVLLFACWLWLRHIARRIYLRVFFPWLDAEAVRWRQ